MYRSATRIGTVPNEPIWKPPTKARMVARMADFARETLREAKGFAARGEWRLAVQRCELIRSRTKVPESVLIETWGVLGVAHVELGSYEEALSFLKRAAPNEATVAAAERCFRELELSGDPHTIFEREAERRVRRKRRGWIAALVALLSIPLLGCCAWIGYSMFGAYSAGTEMMAEYERGRAEGVEAGRTISAAECVERSIERALACGEPDTEAAAMCRMQVTAFRDGCFTVASDRDAYCAAMPSAAEAEDPVQDRCDGREEPAYGECIEAFYHAQALCQHHPP
jgi:hypothetical protein